jgi:hypothetical protein
MHRPLQLWLIQYPQAAALPLIVWRQHQDDEAMDHVSPKPATLDHAAYRFGPNLGIGATPFSPSGLPPDLLGEASPNKVGAASKLARLGPDPSQFL